MATALPITATAATLGHTKPSHITATLVSCKPRLGWWSAYLPFNAFRYDVQAHRSQVLANPSVPTMPWICKKDWAGDSAYVAAAAAKHVEAPWWPMCTRVINLQWQLNCNIVVSC